MSDLLTKIEAGHRLLSAKGWELTDEGHIRVPASSASLTAAMDLDATAGVAGGVIILGVPERQTPQRDALNAYGAQLIAKYGTALLHRACTTQAEFAELDRLDGAAHAIDVLIWLGERQLDAAARHADSRNDVVLRRIDSGRYGRAHFYGGRLRPRRSVPCRTCDSFPREAAYLRPGAIRRVCSVRTPTGRIWFADYPLRGSRWEGAVDA